MAAPPAIAKVLASGTIGVGPNGKLRATVMFSPSGTPAACNGLANWPGAMIAEMQARRWKVNLRIAVLRVGPGSDGSANSYCATTYDAAIKDAKNVTATATWARNAWGDHHAPEWVNALWRLGFGASDGAAGASDPVWCDLGAALERSNKGKALSAGRLEQTQNQSSPPEVDPNKAGTMPSTKASDEVTINAIVPVRQSDLAFLLEAERALELCSTTYWAHGDAASCLAEDKACQDRLIQARDPGSPQPGQAAQTAVDLARLWKDSSARYVEAKKAVGAYYRDVCGNATPDKPATGSVSAAWIVDPADAGGNHRPDIVAKIPAAMNSHVVANQAEDTSQDATMKEFREAQQQAMQAASQRFYAAQGSPALSRLFGLAFDLEIETKAIEDLLDPHAVPMSPELSAHILIGIDDPHLPAPEHSAKVWTIAKYRRAPRHFMAACRAEITNQSHCPHPNLSQFEGLIVLGQKIAISTDDKGCAIASVDRFVLTSLDVPAATESSLDRSRRAAGQALGVNPTKSTGEKAGVDPSKTSKPPPDLTVLCSLARRPTQWARKTQATAGFVLLDRARLEQAASQFAARVVHGARGEGSTTSDIVLDANDLTIGYRVDVAFPLKWRARKGESPTAVDEAPTMKWHTLMARQIDHGTGGPYAVRVRRATAELMGSLSTGAASEWQETLDDAVLALPVRMVATDTAQVDAYVEETIAIWSGEPLAAHCAGPKEYKQVEVDVGAGDRITLPTRWSKPHRCPPPLRFGWPYCFGLRAVYAGGISLPLDEAIKGYGAKGDTMMQGLLTVPAATASNARKVRRFLRHERIDAPFLLLHGELALRANGTMGYESSEHAIVRTALGDDRERGLPGWTQRIFVPPSIDIHFAALHGVFDRVRDKVPPQGLPHVRFDAAKGGFPFVTAKRFEGINGEEFDGPRSFSTREDLQGDIVYLEGPGARPVPYYPDPGACHYALGVRHRGTDTYLEGAAFTVDAYEGTDYPNCRPLVLRIERDMSKRRRTAKPNLVEVISRAAAAPAKTASRALPVVSRGMEVTVTLAPGDDFDIDVWCVPTVQSLAKMFAVVESIGVLALARARKNPTLRALPLEEALHGALAQMLPDPLCMAVKRGLLDCRAWEQATAADVEGGDDGVGGLQAPGHAVLFAIANALHETLSSRPLDEIAAVRTLRATHATARPMVAPLFEATDPQKALRLSREAPPTASTVPTPVLASCVRGEVKAPPLLPEYHVTGDLWIDLASTGAFELRAQTAFPTSAVFDDPRRGRSARDRRNGSWPSYGRDLTPEEVFGFKVAEDGKVTLGRTKFTLLRVEELPSPVSAVPQAQSDGLWPWALETFGSGESVTSLGVVKARHIFPDRKARRLDICVLARPRHELMMRTASQEAHDGRWLRSGKDTMAPSDEHLSSVSVWLPAGVRPAEPVCATPIPSFIWESSGARCSRTALVRIPLGRGWFSSGEEEQLGIVVWPPNLFELMPEDLARESVQTDGERPRMMLLSAFMDDDLGPGGRFVTRWGSDPTRNPDHPPPDTPRRSFVEPGAFLDCTSATRLGFEATVVRRVEMPVRTGALTAADKDKREPQSSIRVSLVTYTPRFDTEAEQWYVDAAIEHPIEAQAFLRLGLVRYQAHAPTDLQVSFPAIQWIQLLPRRDMRVVSEPSPGGRKAEVIVEGVATADDQADNAVDAVATRMWLHFIREYTSDVGLRCREVLQPDVLTERGCRQPAQNVLMSPKFTRFGTGLQYRGPRVIWTATVELCGIDAQIDKEQRARYFAYVEERESYLPATYDNEPVSAKVARGEGDPADLKQTEAGPRFSACVEF